MHVFHLNPCGVVWYRALRANTRHVSPPHCGATRCLETRLSSPLSRCTETRLSSPLSRCTETRLSSPLWRYTVHGDTSLLPTVALHGARRHVSPPHCHATRCTETRLSSPLSRYTVHGDTSLLPTVALHGDTCLLPTVTLHGAWRHVSPPHCGATRCAETRRKCTKALTSPPHTKCPPGTYLIRRFHVVQH